MLCAGWSRGSAEAVSPGEGVHSGLLSLPSTMGLLEVRLRALPRPFSLEQCGMTGGHPFLNQDNVEPHLLLAVLVCGP